MMNLRCSTIGVVAAAAGLSLAASVAGFATPGASSLRLPGLPSPCQLTTTIAGPASCQSNRLYGHHRGRGGRGGSLLADDRRDTLRGSLNTNSKLRTTTATTTVVMGADRGGRGEDGSSSEPIVYAQDALDRAWRSKRRIAAQGRGGSLGRKFLTAFGARQANFVDDRVFMEDTLDNVVRIYCTHNLPSWSMPWQRLKQEHSTSTGFVIDGRRIITNAHSVEYSTMIQVRGRGGDRKYQATRYAVGEECDLAILTVEDEEFWEGTSPLQFGELPELTDQVSVIGYPVGGECISITAGVVSRVEMTEYAQADADLLSIQIDAAINPGNSGGPVVNENGEVVGVAFQSLEGDDVENIGYVVPVNVLEHFLEDVSRHGGKYLGFPRMGITQQRLESPALRESLRMSAAQTGTMITSVEPTAPANKILRKGDVLMKVDGIRVANDGSIPFRSGERVAAGYYMSQLFPEDEVVVELLRDNKVTTATVPLYVSKFLCPVHFGGRPPSYCVLGGLVFTVMSNPYLEYEAAESMSGLSHLLAMANYGTRQTHDEEIVIMTQVLAHEVNVGYEGMSNLQLLKFNGERVKSMEQFIRLVDDNKEPFMRFDLHLNKVMVLEAANVASATTQICEDNSVPAPRSADLLEKLITSSSSKGATSPAGAAVVGQAPAVNGAPVAPVGVEVVPTAPPAERDVALVKRAGEGGGRGKGAGLRSAAAAMVGLVGPGGPFRIGRGLGRWRRAGQKEAGVGDGKGVRRGRRRKSRRSGRTGLTGRG